MISDKNFADWHAAYFGYGYGSGEEYWLPALRELFASDLLPGGRYDHEALVQRFDGLAAWLLINTLCDSGIFTYGTSPRYGWLTPNGEMLKEYVCNRTLEQLEKAVSSSYDAGERCLVNWCNCNMTVGPCNPLFKK